MLNCLDSHTSMPMPTYSQLDDGRFSSGLPAGHPQLSYGKPTYPGQQWRINSYAGDDVRRYASKMPNKGTNAYANAFASSRTGPTSSSAPSVHGVSSAQIAQNKSFSSALSIAESTPSSATHQTIRSAFSTASKPNFGQGIHKPFKVPSMGKSSFMGHSQVNTVETRLTQQSQAVILKPIAPKVPRLASSLPQGKDDTFAFLKNLAKGDVEEVAPPAPLSSKSRSFPKRSSPSGLAAQSKRSRA